MILKCEWSATLTGKESIFEKGLIFESGDNIWKIEEDFSININLNKNNKFIIILIKLICIFKIIIICFELNI